MSWSTSGTVRSAFDVLNLEPTGELGEGARKQLELAREHAGKIVERLDGEQFNVSLSGHSQADMPQSSKDSISISISAI